MIEEQSRGEENIKGINNFLNWAKGESWNEIRRITGIISIKDKILNVEGLKGDKDILISISYRLKEIVYILISE